MIKLVDILETENIAELLSDDELSKIGTRIIEDYRSDKDKWEPRFQQMERNIQIFLQKPTYQPINTNDPNYTNSLITNGIIKHVSILMQEIFKDGQLVKCQVIGDDEGDNIPITDPEGNPIQDEETGKPIVPAAGTKQARGDRQAKALNTYLFNVCKGYQREFERQLTNIFITGAGFTEFRVDPIRKEIEFLNILPNKLVVNPSAKSIREALRVSQRITLTHNEIESYIRLEVFLDKKYDCGYDEDENKRVGMDANVDTDYDDGQEYTFIRQDCYLDLDDDNYKEPYTVFVDTSGKIARIVRRFNDDDIIYDTDYDNNKTDYDEEGDSQEGSESLSDETGDEGEDIEREAKDKRKKSRRKSSRMVISITPEQYIAECFDYPDPEGSPYGLSHIDLVLSNNEVLSAGQNQILKAAKLSNSQTMVGFNKTLSISGEKQLGQASVISINPDAINRNPTEVPDIRQMIMAMPLTEPSSVSFQLYENIKQEIGNVLTADFLDPSQLAANTPATTALAMIDSRTSVLKGVLKRVQEFITQQIKILKNLFRNVVDEEAYKRLCGDMQGSIAVDFSHENDIDIVPVADGDVLTNMQELMRVNFLVQSAQMDPRLNGQEIYKYAFKALGIVNPDRFIAQPQPPAPDPLVQVKAQEMQAKYSHEQQKLQSDSILRNKELDIKQAEIQGNLISERAKIELAMAELQQDGITEAARIRLEQLQLNLSHIDNQIEHVHKQQLLHLEHKKHFDKNQSELQKIKQSNKQSVSVKT